MRIFIVLGISFLISACAGSRPSYLGGAATSLQPCPSSPNCVSSLADPADEQHFIAPLTFDAGDKPIQALVTAISQTENATLIVNQPNYLYAEFSSAILGFVDDVEFLLNANNGQVDVRSASRLGHSDFEVNRKRIETIRAALNNIK